MVPTVVLAQVWRGSRNAVLARFVQTCIVEPLDEELAKAAGVLCGQARTSDIVDAAIVVGASLRRDFVLTSDPKDLLHLAGFVTPRPPILELNRLRLL